MKSWTAVLKIITLFYTSYIVFAQFQLKLIKIKGLAQLWVEKKKHKSGDTVGQRNDAKILNINLI